MPGEGQGNGGEKPDEVRNYTPEEIAQFLFEANLTEHGLPKDVDPRYQKFLDEEEARLQAIADKLDPGSEPHPNDVNEEQQQPDENNG